ncbi:MAG TPA: transposase [Anaeromyxobacteraceae bacterium]
MKRPSRQPAAPEQLTLPVKEKKGWGGKRAGAGRKPGPKPGVRHRPRPALASRHPVHVTLRTREHVWNLRSWRSFSVVEAALRGIQPRPDFRVVHFSVQGNHLHLLVEAHGAGSLGAGLKALTGRISKGLNGMMAKRGAVFSDRYHARVLKTPREVRNALAYVLLNHRSHMARLGQATSDRVEADPYSSAVAFDGWSSGALGVTAASAMVLPVVAARTWLLSTGWRRHRLLSLDETPAAG